MLYILFCNSRRRPFPIKLFFLNLHLIKSPCKFSIVHRASLRNKKEKKNLWILFYASYDEIVVGAFASLRKKNKIKLLLGMMRKIFMDLWVHMVQLTMKMRHTHISHWYYFHYEQATRKKCPGLFKKKYFFSLFVLLHIPSFTYLYSILWIHVFFIFILIGKPHQAITDVPASSPIPPHILCISPLFVQFFFLYILPCLPTFIPCYVLLFLFFFLYLPSTLHSFCHRRCLSFLAVSSSNTKKKFILFFLCVNVLLAMSEDRRKRCIHKLIITAHNFFPDAVSAPCLKKMLLH